MLSVLPGVTLSQVAPPSVVFQTVFGCWPNPELRPTTTVFGSVGWVPMAKTVWYVSLPMFSLVQVAPSSVLLYRPVKVPA